MSKQRFNKKESIFIFVSHLFVLVQNICLKVEDNIKTTKMTKMDQIDGMYTGTWLV